MGESIRIRTELGLNKSINIELNQEFEFLEILSLKLNQQDIYLRACSDYGVIVGRVTANNGLGLPNARVSIFIPIEVVDESNPIISSIYPYKSPEDKNEDGYRYNLLPYEKSYSTHAATGTLPTRLDVLTGNTAFEIYEKYYKFTAKTNESGDYMIMGVPLGEQTVIMDVDLSDIGEFSLTPQDLVRIGRATETQVAGNRFRTSTDLNSLPQIVNLSKSVEISPLWGEPSICQIAINRVDFDLRDDANIDIQPTSVFMGSMFSTPDEFRIRPDIKIGNITIPGSKPKDNFGNLCSLTTGPGQILTIRQTINLDVSGNPILEEYKLEQNGNLIDENGVWLIELPMNLDYYVTNEFGERIISYDPTIGIPTKGKYRFKIKWQQSKNLSEQVRRPYFLVPNVREFGWSASALNSDPNLVTSTSQTNKNKLKSSYYFGLDWSGYTLGFNSVESSTKLDEMINCEDTFYQFDFNRVYTVASLIDQYKNGGRGRFIGIKEIDSNSCDDTVNKFPVNEGFRNFDFLFFIVSLILQIFQIISAPLIVLIHFVAWITNTLLGIKDILNLMFTFLFANEIFQAVQNLRRAAGVALSRSAVSASANAIRGIQLSMQAQATIYSFVPGIGVFLQQLANAIAQLAQNTHTALSALIRELRRAQNDYRRRATQNFIAAAKFLLYNGLLNALFRILGNNKIKVFTLPVILYPDCEACECASKNVGNLKYLSGTLGGFLSRFSDPFEYFENLSQQQYVPSEFEVEDREFFAMSSSQAVGGTLEDPNNIEFYKTMESPEATMMFNGCPDEFFVYSNYLPFGERVNIFNTRKKYFDGVNKIKVSFDSPINTNFHFDNTLTIFTQSEIPSGTLLSFVNPTSSTDVNYLYTGNTGESPGISGTTLNGGPSTYTVNYCDPSDPYQNRSVQYQLSQGTEYSGYTFPADIEYYQVITAITVSQAISLFQGFPDESLPQLVTSNTRYIYNREEKFKVPVLGFCIPLGWGNRLTISNEIPIKDLFANFSSQYIVILQRGVDPYSPLLTNKFGLGHLFGSNNPDAITVTASTRVNIPIQKIDSNSSISIQPFTQNGQNEIFYPSHFFRGGIQNSLQYGYQWSAFTTSNVGYYSSLDASNPHPNMWRHDVGTIYRNAVTTNNFGNAANGSFIVGGIPYNFDEPTGFYQTSEDLSGAAYYFVDAGNRPSTTDITYYTNVFLPSFTANPMNITSNVNNVMRTDRLPSSDILDGGSWNLNPALLQQNLGFAIYEINSDALGSFSVVGYQTGADIPTQNLEGQIAYENVLDTLSVCSKVVSLSCYEGNSTGFTVNKNCVDTDAVINGCYQFVKKPMRNIAQDIRNFNEWAYRFRFFYGLCRGVLSQTFTNNWINGTLFAYPIQTDVTFNSSNRPNPPAIPGRLIYYESDTQNFYYRSSPFVSGRTPTEFIGAPANVSAPQYSINYRNLLSPTTIINLGMKDYFYREIILEPSVNSYIMNNLASTSYSDNSDIVNLFVLSRITNAGFLQQMLNQRDYSVNSLFTRNPAVSRVFQPKNRVDADLVQMLSINNEVGVIPFSPEYYPFNSANPNNAVIVLPQGNNNSTIGIFFSSSTEDLQVKDFISPGVIDFRFNPNVTAVTYRYGIKSQKVPFYQWQLDGNVSNPSIFGNEKNNWATNLGDIVVSNYQSLDRRNIISPNYFFPRITSLDVNQRGYIFNIGTNGEYDFSVFSGMPTRFLIGAPNQFYFGVVKGASAMDKFKEKYLPNE